MFERNGQILGSVLVTDSRVAPGTHDEDLAPDEVVTDNADSVDSGTPDPGADVDTGTPPADDQVPPAEQKPAPAKKAPAKKAAPPFKSALDT